MEKVFWKTVAIAEGAFLLIIISLGILGYSLAVEYADNKEECRVNTCNVQGAISYEYDEYSKICYCYNAEQETIGEKFLG